MLNLNQGCFCSEINGSRVTVHNGEKFFNIQATANVTTSEEPTEFSCQLDIPEANYTARKEAVYFSGRNDLTFGI